MALHAYGGKVPFISLLVTVYKQACQISMKISLAFASFRNPCQKHKFTSRWYCENGIASGIF